MLNKPKKSFLLDILVAIGLVGVVLASIIFVGVEVRSIAEDVSKNRVESDMRLSQLGELGRLKQEAEVAAKKTEILNSVLPDKDGLFSFPAQIESIAKDIGVEARFSFGVEGEDNIGYALVGQGGYSEVVDLLKAIETEIPFITVSSLDIIETGKEYNMNINGNVFFQ